MRKQRKMKIIAVILAAALVITGASVSFAAGIESYIDVDNIPEAMTGAEESATPQDTAEIPEPDAQPSGQVATKPPKEEPIRIFSIEDLGKIGNDPDFPLDGAYNLERDIAGGGAAFTPIGTVDEPFTGMFSGNGHVICGLSIAGGEAAGLFSALDGTVRDLILVDGTVSGEGYAGGLAGKILENARVENTGVFVNVSGSAARSGAIGGFCTAPDSSFVNVLWSNAYRQKNAFGKESANTNGPQTIKTNPAYLEMRTGGSAGISADTETAQSFGLSFSRWEYDSDVLGLEDGAAQAVVTAKRISDRTDLTAVYQMGPGLEVRFNTPVIISGQLEEQKELEPVDPVFPTQMVMSLDDVFPMSLGAPQGVVPAADDTQPPEVKLVMSYFEDSNLRREVAASPPYKRSVYFWDAAGNLLDRGVKYQYTELISPDKVNYDIIYPASELPCFSVIMSDSGSGLATKEIDGADSPYFEYYLSRTPMTKEQLDGVSGWWTVKQYESGIGMNGIEGRWIVYVRVYDKAGNVTYVSSQGFVQDNTGPEVSDVVVTAENETADGWAKSRTVTFRLEDPVLVDGTPGCGLDESRIYVHNLIASSGAPNFSAYGYAAQKNADGTFSMKSDIWPSDTKLNLTAFDIAENMDFEDAHTGPNYKQNELAEMEKIDSVAPKAESIAQAPDGWSREKTISASVKDTAEKMGWDLDIDDDGNIYTYPILDEEVVGSGLQDIFLSENKNAQPGDEGNIEVKRPVSFFRDAGGAQNISAKVDHNGTYYLILTDRVGNRAEYPVSVTTIDNTLPVVMEVTHTPISAQDRYLSEAEFTLHVSGISDEKETGIPGSVVELWYGTENDATKAQKADGYVADTADWDIPVTPPEGATTYFVWAKDAFGNYSEPVSTTIYKDTEAPVIGQPFADPSGWTNSAEVTLTVPGVTDEASGVKTVLYAEHPIADAADGQEMTLTEGTATATAAPAAEGSHTYYFRAVDGAGNLSAEKSVLVRIDRSAPTGSIKEGGNIWQNFLDTITFGQYHKESTAFSIEAVETMPDGVDEVSGIASIEYYVRETDPAADTLSETKDAFMEASKDWEWQAYTPLSDVAVPIDPNAKRVIYARLSDNAGNVTHISSEGLVFDNTPPAVSQITTTMKDGNRLVEFQLTDAVSGVDGATVKYGASADGTGEMKTPAYNEDQGYSFEVPAGDTPYYIYAADKAGNAMQAVKIPEAGESGEADNNQAGSGKPKTGDTATDIWLYILLAAGATVALIAAVKISRRKHQGEK